MPELPAPKTSEPRTLVTHPELRSHQSLPAFRTLGEPPKNVLERLLSFFADVRAGEGAGAVLLTLNIFLLLAGYSLMKPARDGLILTEGNAGDRVLLGGRAGRSADGRRAALRLARHARRPDPPDLHDAAVFRGDLWLLRCWADPACARAWRSTSGWASSTSSSSPSSGPSPTTSTRRARAGGCFRSSASGSHSARGSARRRSSRWFAD